MLINEWLPEKYKYLKIKIEFLSPYFIYFFIFIITFIDF